MGGLARCRPRPGPQPPCDVTESRPGPHSWERAEPVPGSTHSPRRPAGRPCCPLLPGTLPVLSPSRCSQAGTLPQGSEMLETCEKLELDSVPPRPRPPALGSPFLPHQRCPQAAGQLLGGLHKCASGVDQSPGATITDYHTLGGFKPQKCVLSVLEAGSPRSRCGRATLPPGAPREDLPASGGSSVPLLVALSLRGLLCLPAFSSNDTCHCVLFPPD